MAKYYPIYHPFFLGHMQFFSVFLKQAAQGNSPISMLNWGCIPHLTNLIPWPHSPEPSAEEIGWRGMADWSLRCYIFHLRPAKSANLYKAFLSLECHPRCRYLIKHLCKILWYPMKAGPKRYQQCPKCLVKFDSTNTVGYHSELS